jgi:FSR family fosmidomycin resistance protein-like MFS transporter
VAEVGVRATVAPGRVLFVASAIHVVNDAFFALLYPLLPLVAAEFDLSYAETGLLKTAFSGAASLLQYPAGLLAERWGEFLLLLAGNAWVALGLIAMGLAPGFAWLAALAVLGGLGGNTQHPLASSLVARAYPHAGRTAALGTLNFAGDLGKMAGPALVGLAALGLGWRGVLLLVGGLGVLISLAALTTRGWMPPRAPGITRDTAPGGAFWSASFGLLMLVGVLDAATRAAGLTFLPFVLGERGVDAAAIGLLFTVIFAGGAAGKFVCGWLGERWGALGVVWATEGVTAAALVLFLGAPGLALLPLALLFGFALNGTSSILYAAVAELVPEHRRARGYGAYYTATQCAAALAPAAYGALADQAGLSVLFSTMALATLAILPLSGPLRRALR